MVRIEKDYVFTTRLGEAHLIDLFDLTAFGRQEDWEDSPEGYPQTPPYAWWIRHDEPHRTSPAA